MTAAWKPIAISRLDACSDANLDLSSHGTQPKCSAVCSDGRTYIIKVPDSPETSNEFIGELVSAALADHVQIRVPDCATVCVSDGMLHTFKGVLAKGEYFGSLFLPQRTPLPKDVVVDGKLASALYPLLAYDLLILNPDRKSGDVLYTPMDTEFATGLIAIDQSNAFSGGNWTVEKLTKLNAATETIDPHLGDWVFRSLLDEGAARSAAGKIRNFTDNFEEALERAASFVRIENDQMTALVGFLRTRFERLNELAGKQIARTAAL